MSNTGGHDSPPSEVGEGQAGPRRFRKKPVVIVAEQYDSAQTQRGVCFCRLYGPAAHLHTIHEGQAVVLKHGDWIVPEPDGIHYYPIKSGIFEATYEPAD